MPTNEKDTHSWRPVYCQLAYITGLEEQKARCEQMLSKVRNDKRVVVLLRVSGDWLYGQCNFKWESEDRYNFKFFDTIETIIGRDLELLAQSEVSKLIFVERDLFEDFEAKRDKDFEAFVMESLLLED